MIESANLPHLISTFSLFRDRNAQFAVLKVSSSYVTSDMSCHRCPNAPLMQSLEGNRFEADANSDL